MVLFASRYLYICNICGSTQKQKKRRNPQSSWLCSSCFTTKAPPLSLICLLSAFEKNKTSPPKGPEVRPNNLIKRHLKQQHQCILRAENPGHRRQDSHAVEPHGLRGLDGLQTLKSSAARAKTPSCDKKNVKPHVSTASQWINENIFWALDLFETP